MATAPAEVRDDLQLITTEATAQLTLLVADSLDEAAGSVLASLNEAMRAVVPGFFDASGTLAVAWYDELRDAANPTAPFDPTIISEPNTDWLERELNRYADKVLSDLDTSVDLLAGQFLAQAEALAQKEVARGFRETIAGNTRVDPAAIGWSRHTRPGACKFCLMLARGSVFYRSERAARVAAHTTCHCVARPEFAGGEHGPEASALQYVAAQRKRTPAERQALRDYLNQKYPDAPG